MCCGGYLHKWSVRVKNVFSESYPRILAHRSHRNLNFKDIAYIEGKITKWPKWTDFVNDQVLEDQEIEE